MNLIIIMRRHPKQKKDIGNELGGIGFVAGLFIGLGSGMAFGRPDVGVLIGLGIGFILMLGVRMNYHGR
jgi:hypothetical protein